MSYDVPRVRLTVDHMRHEIIQAFATHADGMKESVEAAVDDAIRHFNYKAAVQEIADEVMREIVKDAVQHSLRALRWDEAARAEMAVALRRALAEPCAGS